MSTLAEIEAAISQLSSEELIELEQAVRAFRQKKSRADNQSAFDLPPLQLSEVLRPLTREDDLLQEMLEDIRF